MQAIIDTLAFVGALTGATGETPVHSVLRVQSAQTEAFVTAVGNAGGRVSTNSIRVECRPWTAFQRGVILWENCPWLLRRCLAYSPFRLLPHYADSVDGGPDGTRQWLQGLRHHPTVDRVVIKESGLTADDLEVLGTMPRLKTLVLDGVELKGEHAWKCLLGCTRHLETLQARKTNIDDGGLESLGRLPGFEHLVIGSTPAVSDRGVGALARSQTLFLFFVLGERDRITDAGLRELVRAPSLESIAIEIVGGRVTIAGVDRIRAARPEFDIVAIINGVELLGDLNGSAKNP